MIVYWMIFLNNSLPEEVIFNLGFESLSRHMPGRKEGKIILGSRETAKNKVGNGE